MKTKALFDSGAMLNRDYNGHQQMLMNEGAFIELADSYAESEAVEFAKWIMDKKIEYENNYFWKSNLRYTITELYKLFKSQKENGK